MGPVRSAGTSKPSSTASDSHETPVPYSPRDRGVGGRGDGSLVPNPGAERHAQVPARHGGKGASQSHGLSYRNPESRHHGPGGLPGFLADLKTLRRPTI